MCERTAVCRIESGPEVNSCSSRAATSNSLYFVSVATYVVRIRSKGP